VEGLKTGRRNAYRSNITVGFILFEATGDGEEEYDVPGNADLSPHLQVDVPNAGIQASTHEKVINEASRHTHGLSSNDSCKVHEERDKPTPEHSDSHEVAEVVDDTGQTENVEVVQAGGGEQRIVHAYEGITVVHEGLVSEGWDRETFLLVSPWHEVGKEELMNHESGVYLPGVPIR